MKKRNIASLSAATLLIGLGTPLLATPAVQAQETGGLDISKTFDYVKESDVHADAPYEARYTVTISNTSDETITTENASWTDLPSFGIGVDPKWVGQVPVTEPTGAIMDEFEEAQLGYVIPGTMEPGYEFQYHFSFFFDLTEDATVESLTCGEEPGSGLYNDIIVEGAEDVNLDNNVACGSAAELLDPPSPTDPPLPTDPTEPTDPTDPTTEPTDPTDPTTEPTDPTGEPTDPTTEPTDPTTEPTGSDGEPTDTPTETPVTDSVVIPLDPGADTAAPAAVPAKKVSTGGEVETTIWDKVRTLF